MFMVEVVFIVEGHSALVLPLITFYFSHLGAVVHGETTSYRECLKLTTIKNDQNMYVYIACYNMYCVISSS